MNVTPATPFQKYSRAVAPLAVLALGLSYSTPAAAQEDTDTVQELTRRIAALEAASKKQAPAKADKKKPFGWRIPGTKTELTVGGYIKLDAIVTSQSTANDYTTGAGRIATTNNKGEDWQTLLHARQSRVWFKTLTPTDAGPLKTYLSIDFFGGTGSALISNPHVPRLRHAWGSLGPVLAGQTWSTFMQLSGLPPNLDFLGTVGTVFVRNPQIRYTRALGDGLSFSVAVENPYTRLYSAAITGDYTGAWTPGDDQLPDLVARVDHKGDYGQVGFAVIGRQLRYDLDTDAASNNDTAYGFGASLGFKLNYSMGNLRGMVVGGTGLGRYLSTAFAPAGWVEYDQANGLPTAIGGTIPGVGGTLAYQHLLNAQWSVALSYSMTTIMLPDELDNMGLNKNVMQGTLTLAYTPVKPVMFGIEYNLERRETDSDAAPDPDLQHRIQASAMFKF